mmetsp:Transcript_11553/g.34021  ORF Transcript_11553/g.34021 Transcript_11553/m.34021 type:complete len:207 (+) Transcript_11553:705-1325(+)
MRSHSRRHGDAPDRSSLLQRQTRGSRPGRGAAARRNFPAARRRRAALRETRAARPSQICSRRPHPAELSGSASGPVWSQYPRRTRACHAMRAAAWFGASREPGPPHPTPYHTHSDSGTVARGTRRRAPPALNQTGPRSPPSSAARASRRARPRALKRLRHLFSCSARTTPCGGPARPYFFRRPALARPRRRRRPYLWQPADSPSQA